MMQTKPSVTELSYQVIGCAIGVHWELGSSYLESVYEKCLRMELERWVYYVKQQLKVPIQYHKEVIDIEIKTRFIDKQNDCGWIESNRTYFAGSRSTTLNLHEINKTPQGLLINLFTDNITKSMKPFVNEYFKAFQ